MANPSDQERHKADLEWLYGGKRPEPEPTKIWTDAEEAELARRSAAPEAPEFLDDLYRPQQGSAPQSYPPSQTGPYQPDPYHRPPPRQPLSQQSVPQQSDARQPGSPIPPAYRPSPYQPPQQPPPPPSAPSKKRKRRPIRRFFGTLALLILAWLIYLVMVPLITIGQMNRVDDSPEGTRPPEQPGTAILLVGSDSRAGLTEQEQKELGTGTTQGQRTDTMMILYQPLKGSPVLISLPRDSYLPIPGYGKNKLNAAYAFGGPKLLIQTIEQNTGLRIDGYIEIGFGGFVNLVDAVGGVEICLDQPMLDRDSHADLPAGCQTLNGKDALSYVRMRKADPRGDLGRMERQREFIGALIKKLATPMTVINPVRYWKVNRSLTEVMVLGENTSFGDLFGAARAIISISAGKGTSLTVPVSDPNRTTDAGSSMIWDDAAATELFEQIARGDTSNLDRFEQP